MPRTITDIAYSDFKSAVKVFNKKSRIFFDAHKAYQAERAAYNSATRIFVSSVVTSESLFTSAVSRGLIIDDHTLIANPLNLFTKIAP